MTGAGVRVPAPAQRGAGVASPRALGAAAAVALLLGAGWVGVEAHAGHALEALPDSLRAGAAAIALFALTGYAPAALLTPAAMRPHLPLLVLPLGAVCSSLVLTALGFLHVPFAISLAALLAAGVVSLVPAHGRLGPTDAGEAVRSGGTALRVAWPGYIALFLIGLALLPAFREGFVTTLGENPDADLVTGAAEVVREGPPTAIQPDLPVDRVSKYWQSKYPIYYSLAAVSALSGLDPVQVFPVQSALLLALVGAGIFLLAFHGLGMGPAGSLLAMGVVSADRVSLYLVEHPYYNQLWGAVALPFMLLFGYRFLRDPGRATAALFVLFSAVGLFAYPLMLPFPAVALGVAALLIWRRERREGRPLRWLSALGLPRRRLVWIPRAVIGGLLALGLSLAAIDKGVSALAVIVPGGNLDNWAGDSPDYALPRYFGSPDAVWLAVPALGLVACAALAGLTRLRREERVGMGVMIGGAIVMAANFAGRRSGEYFLFKVLAFLGPIVLLLAVVGLCTWMARSRGPARALAGAGAAALVLFALAGARDELDTVSLQAPEAAFELRSWADDLPPDASLRVDVPPSGLQLWVAYLLHERPLSASAPVAGTTYPALVRGRKADYVLMPRGAPVSPDAAGQPVRRNDGFVLLRMDPRVPGPDRSSRERVQP